MRPTVPITNDHRLPAGVPLVADFHDDRNRLSYYYPLLEAAGVRTPETKFMDVGGSLNSFPNIEYREMTEFMQEHNLDDAFVRGDYSSAKYDGDSGSRIESHDPFDIESVVLELFRQLARSDRWLGGKIAVREWIPHDIEVRYFIRDGAILYGDCIDDFYRGDWPTNLVEQVADVFNTLSWSCDFIRHEQTGKWYCIDMGLDGLHRVRGEWIAISEHPSPEYSPMEYADEMPRLDELLR
jgi:hypothetical protein